MPVQVPPVHFRQNHVRDQQIDGSGMAPAQGQGLGRGCRSQDPVGHLFQHALDQLQDIGFIFHHQNGFPVTGPIHRKFPDRAP